MFLNRPSSARSEETENRQDRYLRLAGGLATVQNSQTEAREAVSLGNDPQGRTEEGEECQKGKTGEITDAEIWEEEVFG